MGAVFSVNLQADIKQGHKLALLDSLVSPMSESQIEYLNSKELDMNKLEDVLAYYFAANSKISVDIINDKIDISTGFDASYSWECVMIEAFEKMEEHLEDKSELYIYPDSDYDWLVIRNGKMIQKH